MALLDQRGFTFSETMSGTWQPVDGSPPQAMEFQVRAHAPVLSQYLRDGLAELEGTVFAEGLADSVPATGTLTIRPMRERIIRYQLAFQGDDGEHYQLIGQKDLRLRRPVSSLTTLPAEILDEMGTRVGTCVVRFSLRQLGPFLTSWRLA